MVSAGMEGVSDNYTIELERFDGEPVNPADLVSALKQAGYKVKRSSAGLRMTTAFLLRQAAEDIGAALRLAALQAEREGENE